MREFDENLEVALSGGGLRAAAFGLGVLLYLVHSGLNKRVGTISSVSGGSITNGFVAQNCNFAKLTEVEEFKEKVAKRLAKKISGRGNGEWWRFRGFRLVSWLFLAFVLLSGGALLVWFIPMAVGLLAQLIYGAVLPLASLREWVVFGVIAFAWFLFGLNREYPVKWWLSWTFFRGERKTLGSMSERAVDHVFCATDLNASHPFFFSTKGGGRVVSEIYGRGDGRDERLVDAVRASAAFPPAIPPMHLEIYNRDFTKYSQETFPRTIVLTDGGVWNNLGTDWSRLRSMVSTEEANWSKSRRSSHDADPSSQVRNDPAMSEVLLVANASKPDELKKCEAVWHKFPLVSFFRLSFRVVDITSNSTVAGRTAGIEESAAMRMLDKPDRQMVHFRTGWEEEVGTPSSLAVLVEMTRKPGETAKAWGREAERLPESLKPLLEDEDDIVPTTFNHLGRDRTLRMILLGYVIARESLSVFVANHNPPKNPERKWFEDLLDSSQHPQESR